jgi:tetratricopeptide (TPR) repeat protein
MHIKRAALLRAAIASLSAAAASVLCVAALVAGLGVGSASAQALRIDARAEVAAALYAASATQAASDRLANAQLRAAQAQIARLQRQGTAARADLIAAQETFVAELGRRDREYAEFIDGFRASVETIAQTEEGVRLLSQRRPGNLAQVRTLLIELADRRDAAIVERANLERAANRRAVAQIAMDDRDRGEATTEDVIALYEQVVALDPGSFEDWLDLSSLYDEVANFPASESAVERAAALADDLRERSLVVYLRAELDSRRRDWAGARTRFEQFVSLSREGAAANPGATEWTRSIAVGLGFIGQLFMAEGDTAAAHARYAEALAIYQQLLATDSANPTALADVAEANRRLGDVLVETGEHARALELYQTGLRTERTLVELDPTSVERRSKLASSLNDLGTVLLAQGDVHGARAAFTESLGIRRRLAAEDSSAVFVQQSLALGLSRVAILLGPHDAPASHGYFQECIDILRRIVSQYPQVDNAPVALVFVLTKYADELGKAGDPRAARARHGEAVSLAREHALGRSDDLSARLIVAVAVSAFSEFELSEGNVEAAVSGFDESLNIIQGLAAADPSGERLRQGSAFVMGDVEAANPLLAPGLLMNQGELLREHGDFPRSLNRYQSALGLLRNVADTDRQNADVQAAMADCLAEIGGVLDSMRDVASAREHYTRSLEIRRRLAGEHPQSAYAEKALAEALVGFGDFLFRQDDVEGALLHYRQALERFRGLAERRPSDWDAPVDVGNVLANIGDALAEQNDMRGAQASYEEVVDIADALIVAHPRSPYAQVLLSEAHGRLAELAAQRRDWSTSVRHYELTVQADQLLADLDPRHAEFQQRLALSMMDLGDALDAQGDPNGARQRYEQSMAIYRRLSVIDPSSATASRGVWVLMLKLKAFSDSGITWQLIVSVMEDLDRRGLLTSDEQRLFNDIRVRAAAEQAR